MAALIITSTAFLFLYRLSHADDSTLWTTVTTPDALIIIDNSGSMAELPQGSNATFYLHGNSGSCTGGSAGPLYTTTGDCVPSATVYASNTTSCTGTGPYNLTCSSCMPLGTLIVAGTGTTNCGTSYTGAYYFSTPSDAFDSANITNVYISNSSCSTSYNGPYYVSSGTGHTKSCSASTYIPSTSYSSGDCTNGPFYRSTASGYVTCNKYTSCNNPFSTTVYSANADCSVGPIYRSSGTGHTTACPATAACTSSYGSLNTTSLYVASDCSTGPYYKSSGTGHTARCYFSSCICSGVDTSTTQYSTTATCDGPFYASSSGRTNCSKIAIAKRALFDLMDANNDGTINATDQNSLNMRFGLMHYYNCNGADNDTGSNVPWTRGCENLIWPITQSDNITTTPYANIFCDSTSCTSTTACQGSDECINGMSTGNGTPLGDALREGKLYLDYHKNLDASASCRQKSIILITDGADTFSCGGNGSTTDISQRRSPVFYANQANLANYKVYVVGFGAAMPADLQNTLNWTAYYGGSRNSNSTQSGSTTAVTVGTDPCSNGGDPASSDLSGYAFLASNPTQLVFSLQTALSDILAATYSFSTQASVAAARLQSENYIYEASFEPQNSSGVLKEPFWPGHLKKYVLNNNGTLPSSPAWDAGVVLRDTNYTSRHMWTLKNGAMTAFANVTYSDLAVADTAAANAVIGFYQGNPTYNNENWKLGDLFHTNPVLIKVPMQYFYDPRDTTGSHYTFWQNNPRRASHSEQSIIAGADDCQVHAFQTEASCDPSCPTTGGNELWSFIPPNLLQKLQVMAHTDPTDRTTITAYHDYFVDGPLQEADVWLPSSWNDGTNKSSSDWKSIVIVAEGQGSGNYLWSASPNCYSASTSGFTATYDSTHSYYCGYYALNVTNAMATTPAYLWHLMPTTAQAPYLGQAWSKMQIGRIKDGANEKWVGFIGGGYDSTACDGVLTSTCNNAGKGFFVVDLQNGNIIWSYTAANDGNMDFSVPGAPYAVDLDNDGFIDTVYMGDLGGNIWRFRLCPASLTSCSTSNWTGSVFFSSTGPERGTSLSPATDLRKQIFTSPTVTKDPLGNVWVYFGTGENNDPIVEPANSTTTNNRLYGVKEDQNFTANYTSTNLLDITTTTTTECTRGWYYRLSSKVLTRSDSTTVAAAAGGAPLGEKMISDPTVFGGIVYFPTYVPAQTTTNACGMAGDAFLYKFQYTCPNSTSEQSIEYVGHGVPSSILISYRSDYSVADTYVTASGGAGTSALTQDAGQAPTTTSMSNILYWKDKRVQ